MLSKAREAKGSESNGGEAIDTKDVGSRKKAVFEIEGVLLHYTRALGNTMTSIHSHKAHHLSIRERVV